MLKSRFISTGILTRIATCEAGGFRLSVPVAGCVVFLWKLHHPTNWNRICLEQWLKPKCEVCIDDWAHYVKCITAVKKVINSCTFEMVKRPTHTCMLGQLHVQECIKYTSYVFTVAIFRLVDPGFPGWIPKVWSPTYYLAEGRKQNQEIWKETYEVAKSENQKL